MSHSKKNIKEKITKLKWERKPKLLKAQRCAYESNIFLDVADNANPLTIFERSATLLDLLHLILEQIDFYVAQNFPEFQTISYTMRAFLGLNYDVYMQDIKGYWAAGNYIGNQG